MRDLIEKIKNLDQKMDVRFGDLSKADVLKDGLFDKREAGAMITGLVGGKGTLADSSNLDDVKTGGIYYLPKENNYNNDPSQDLKALYDSNFRASLTVVKNYGNNPHTDSPIVYQKYETTTYGGGDFYATRWFMNGSWDKWAFPLGKPLFIGSANMNTKSIVLNQNVKDFNKIEIHWKPLRQPNHIELLDSGSQRFIMQAINVQDNSSSVTTPSVSFEELRIDISSDGQTLTPHYDLVYLANNQTSPNSDSSVNALVQITSIRGISRG